MEERRFLGEFVVSTDGKQAFTMHNVHDWKTTLVSLSKVAVTEPQAAVTALNSSLQCECNLLHRGVDDTSNWFQSLEVVITDVILTGLLGVSRVPTSDRSLFSSPAKR